MGMPKGKTDIKKGDARRLANIKYKIKYIKN